MAHRGDGLSIVIGAFGGKATESLETGERHMADWHNRGAAPLVSSVLTLLRLKKVGIASLGECRLGSSEERCIIAFKTESVVGFGVLHRLGHGRMTVQRISGHRAAFQRQTFEQIEGRLDFPTTWGAGTGNGEPCLGIPD